MKNEIPEYKLSVEERNCRNEEFIEFITKGSSSNIAYETASILIACHITSETAFRQLLPEILSGDLIIESFRKENMEFLASFIELYPFDVNTQLSF